jgi:hypothetical protein
MRAVLLMPSITIMKDETTTRGALEPSRQSAVNI